MASNLHSTLEEAQLHNPKGFSTASNNTHIIKNSSGNLEWQTNNTRHLISTGGYHSSSGSVGAYYAKQFPADYHNFNVVVDPADATNGTENEGRKWAHVYSEFVCHTSGSISSWKVMYGGTASADWDLELYKLSITNDESSNADLTLLGTKLDLTNGAAGTKDSMIADMSYEGTVTFAANDVLIVLIRKQTAGSKTIWWNGTLEVAFDY
jgi:hypothetical protein